ncbi:response regulator transcription factor [Kitasatospora sp. NPDC057223]|uniref:response regulator transcription factor n=1 Tax=Kitasatospora sp. NPDC057223 TaxID=3346055 RepID=UPI0036441D18
MADAPFLGGGDGVTGRPTVGPLPLTDKQLEVLERRGRGQDMWQIAREMQISVFTARGHLKAAKERLDATDTADAVAKAISLKLISPAGGSDVR